MKQAVITGADGFIGSNLVRFLIKNGVEVWALVIKNSPTLWRIPSNKLIHIVEYDFSNNFPDIPDNVDAFYHLAWQGVAPEERNSLEIQIKNIEISVQALKLANKFSACRFILPGSTMEYLYCGKAINMDALPSPQNAYGAVKLSVRYICSSLAKDLGQTFIYTVFTGVYGGNRLDNNIITYTITSLLKGERPILTELKQLWDYIHIDDLVEALYLIGKKGRNSAFYSVGHGDNWPLYNYIFRIRDLIDPSLPLGIGELPYASAELPASCVDMTDLQRDTGFLPHIPFEEGIVPVIEQIKKNISA